MITLEQSIAEAERLLDEAGWHACAHKPWGGRFTTGTLVGGHAPTGVAYVKNWAAITPDDPRYSADTPDEPHEAAAWLIEHAKQRGAPDVAERPVEDDHETEQPVLGEPGDDGDAGAGDSEPDGAGVVWPASDNPSDSEFGFGDSGADEEVSKDDEWPEEMADDEAMDERIRAGPLPPAEPTDADFEEYEPQPAGEIEGADPDLNDDPLVDFNREQPAQDRVYGLDDWDRLVNRKIGAVVRLSREKQAAIWAEAQASEGEYRDLLNQVMRDTINGSYQGPPEPYERFVELQRHANAALAVADVEDQKIRALESLSLGSKEDRETFAAIDPDEGWPG